MNTQQGSKLIPVSLLGMNERMTHTLEYFFSHAADESYYKIVDNQKAEIIILDIDTIEGKRIFQDEQALFNDKHLIVLSIKKPQKESIAHVQKPIKSSDLLAAINTILETSPQQEPKEQSSNSYHSNQIPSDTEQQEETPMTNFTEPLSSSYNMNTRVDINLAVIQENLYKKTPSEVQSKPKNQNLLQLVKTGPTNARAHADRKNVRDHLVGTAPDINPENSEQFKSRSYNPDEYFQGYFHSAVMNAKRQNQPIRLNIPKGSIVALPNASTVLIDTTESRLQAFSSIPLSEQTLTVFFLDKEQLKAFSQQATPGTIYSLLWKSAIWASRGRFPLGTNLYQPVKLQQWSKVSSQVMTFKHTEKIANLWAQNSVSLLETAKELKIPQRYIFTFYSACHAIGIASTIDPSHHKKVYKKKKPLKSKFMSSVIKRFKLP